MMKHEETHDGFRRKMKIYKGMYGGFTKKNRYFMKRTIWIEIDFSAKNGGFTTKNGTLRYE